MDIGITTRCFGGWTNQDTARKMAELGFPCTELCFVQSDSSYWVYNGRSDISDLSCQRVGEITACYEKEGISVCALGVFTSCVEHDPDQRRANIQYFKRHMEYASYCGVPWLATECGFDPQCRSLRAEYYETDFQLMKDTISELAEYAEKLGVGIAIEACVLDVLPSAKRLRDFLDQVGSPRVKAMLDPANLIANSSEEDMFRYLHGRIAYFHGKDRKVNDAYGRLLGDGDIDWPLFFKLYHTYGEGLPFILEYPNPDNAAMTRERALAFDQASYRL